MVSWLEDSALSYNPISIGGMIVSSLFHPEDPSSMHLRPTHALGTKKECNDSPAFLDGRPQLRIHRLAFPRDVEQPVLGDFLVLLVARLSQHLVWSAGVDMCDQLRRHMTHQLPALADRFTKYPRMLSSLIGRCCDCQPAGPGLPEAAGMVNNRGALGI